MYSIAKEFAMDKLSYVLCALSVQNCLRPGQVKTRHRAQKYPSEAFQRQIVLLGKSLECSKTVSWKCS